MQQHSVGFSKSTSFSVICHLYLVFSLPCKGSSDSGRVGFVLYQNDKLFLSRVYQSLHSLSKRVICGNVDGGIASSVKTAFSPKVRNTMASLNQRLPWPYCILQDLGKETPAERGLDVFCFDFWQ